MDVVDAEGNSVARRGRRARLPQAVPGHDARLLARPRALPRHVLAPAARRVGARRLGLGRRGRLLVPARPLGRHAQHRRASGSGPPSSSRPPSGTRRSPRRQRSACRTRSRARWRGSSASSLPATKRAKSSRLRYPTRSTGELGQGVQARPRDLRLGACRRRGARRSCAAPSARRRSARMRATSRRSRTPNPWRRSQMPSEDRLDGQIALVTGGGRGIGASIARELAAAGAKVAVSARTARAGRGGRERDRRARRRRRRHEAATRSRR